MSIVASWRGRWLVLVAGLATAGTDAAAAPATRPPPDPNATPIAVVADAAAAAAALDEAWASGRALVAELTLGHEGRVVRANSAEPLSPGRYRLHAMVACTDRDQVLGEAVAVRLVAGGDAAVPLPSGTPKTPSGGLQPAAGQSQAAPAPASWNPGQRMPTVHLDFTVETSGRLPIAVDWFLRDGSVNHEIRPAPQDHVARRQNALNKLGLVAGPGEGLAEVPPDDTLDELEAEEPAGLSPRPLAGQGLPPHRLLLAGLVVERLSPVVQVRLDGRACLAHYAPVATIAGFDLLRPGTVEIECKGTIRRAEVRPKALGIRPVIDGKRLSFPLAAPASLSVEIDGDIREPLFLFADPPEQDAPRPDVPGVRFFAAGKVHDAGKIVVESGETVYIERGAVVRGRIFMDGVHNVKILGRGILDGGVFRRAETRMLEIKQAEDVLVEGITIVDSKHWALPILRSDRVTVRRVKIVSGNDWDDGVVVVGSRNVAVEKCFIRTKDDCVAIKAGLTYFTQTDCQGDVENVAVRECVLWSAEHGSGLQIQTQSWLPDWIGKPPDFAPRVTRIHDVRFADNDLLHAGEGAAVLAVRNADQATVCDVRYEDLRVEDCGGVPVVLTISRSPYAPDAGRGHVRDIVFRNIRVEGARVLPVELAGFDDEHRIEGVVFENVECQGRKWVRPEDAQVKAAFATGVEFR